MKMKIPRFMTFGLFAIIAAAVNLGATQAIAAENRDRSFDSDWRFLRADAPGAQTPGLDDSGWRTLDVPHDWSIDDLPAWKARDFDDRGWQSVVLPGTGWPASVGIEAAARRPIGAKSLRCVPR